MSLKIDRLQLEIVINNDQARKSLRALEEESRQLTNEMKKLDKTSQEYVDKSKRLNSIKQQMDNIYESIGITGLTMKELINRQKELNLVMRNMDPRLPEYKKLQDQAKAVGDRISELKGKAKDTGLSIGKVADGFNKYFAMATAGVASLTGVIFSLRKVVDVANLFEKRVDNLSALTGLMGRDLEWLSIKALDMSTSVIEGNVRIASSATEIVDAYTKVGSKRPELLKVKEDLHAVTQEAMILAAASNGELQPAVDGLTMVMNQFNLPASEARRIINVLAAGSKEGAGEVDYLTVAFEKSGSVASMLGISIEELTGSLETLAPRITAPEMAGRSLRNILIKLEEQNNDKLKPSLQGLGKAFENLRDMQLDIAALSKMFGEENINAATILMNNTAETKKYTDAVTGTSIALEQAAINTDNNTSKLEQARNSVQKLSIEFGQKLAPAMTFSTNIFAAFMRVALGAPDFFHRYQIAIIAFTGALLAYNAALIKSTALKVIDFVWSKNLIAQWIRSHIVLNAMVAAEKLKAIWTVQGTVATKLATTAQYAWNAAMKANPIGIVITAITALVTAIKLYDKYSAESVWLEDQKKRAINQLAATNGVLKKTYEELSETMKEFNKLSFDEKRQILENTKARLKQAEADLIGAKAKQELIKQENTRLTFGQKVMTFVGAQRGSANTGKYIERKKGENAAEAAATMDEGIKELEDNIKMFKEASAQLDETINAESLADKITGKTVYQLEEKQRLLQAGLKNYEKGTEDYIRISKKLTAVNKQLEDEKPAGDLKDIAKSLEDAYKQQQDIHKRSVESEISIMEKGYEKELFILHAAYVDQREAIKHELDTNTKLTTEQKEQLNTILTNLDTKYVQDYEKLLKEQSQGRLAFEKNLLSLKIAAVKEGSDEEYQLKKQLLENEMQSEIASVAGSEEQKLQLISAIKEKYARLNAEADENYSRQFLDDKLKQDITALTKAETQKLALLEQKRAAGEISQREYNKQLKAIQSQFTKDSLTISLEKAERELEIIKAAGGDIIQAEEAIAAIRLKIQQGDKQDGTQKGSGFKDWSTSDKLNTALDAASTIADGEFQIVKDKNQRELDDTLNKLAKEKEAALSNKRLTEQQKEAINNQFASKERAAKKKAWEKQHKADLAMAWVNLALSVGKAAINAWPIPAIPLMALAAISGGMQIAAISKQTVPEFARGKYLVTGQQSGNQYVADYTGPAKTGMYTKPSLVGLVGEKGPEIVIDPSTTRNLQMNYPEVINAINYARVPQYASGSYPAAQPDTTRAKQPAAMSDPEMIRAMNRFSDAMEKVHKDGVKGNWSLFDLEKIQDDKASIQSATDM